LNEITKILYKYKIIKLTDKKVSHWIATEQIENIIFAAEKGNYKIRIKILEGIKGLLGKTLLHNIAIKLIDDKVQIVSEKSMEVLKFHISDPKSELLKRIINKQNYWIEEGKKVNKKFTWKSKKTWKLNKDSMVRLKEVKKQLRKSMYGEKWM